MEDAGSEFLEKDSLETRKVAIVLLEGFSLMAFSSFVEPLRAVNRNLGRQCYDWIFISKDASPVRASCGAVIQTEAGLEEFPDYETVCLVSGTNITDQADERLLAWLRRQAVQGKNIGALSTGAYILARAGLLDGKRCTIHWEGLESFRETFPKVNFTGATYEIDEKRFSAAGGVSVMDLVLHWIGDRFGPLSKAAISDQFLHGLHRDLEPVQKADTFGRYGVHNDKLLSVIHLMEQNLEEPLSRQELASEVAITIRQLERLFAKYLNMSPSHFYLRLRLERARDLLHQTAMPISEVAIACGFVNFSHFARSYRGLFNRSPREERG